MFIKTYICIYNYIIIYTCRIYTRDFAAVYLEVQNLFRKKQKIAFHW